MTGGKISVTCALLNLNRCDILF